MKLKIVAFLVAVLTVVSAFAACGTVEETESGDAVVIDTETETETETDAETQGDTETETGDEFDNPAWNEDASDERKYLFKYTFDNVKSMKAEDNADFALTYHSSYPFELVGGENGYIQNKGDDGYIFITDKNSRLNGKSFIFEAEMTFNSMPVERESNKGKGSYPLSILSWIRKNDSKASYDFAFKMDGDGYIYTTSMTQHTGVKLEVGRKYVISAYYTWGFCRNICFSNSGEFICFRVIKIDISGVRFTVFCTAKKAFSVSCPRLHTHIRMHQILPVKIYIVICTSGNRICYGNRISFYYIILFS